MLYDQAQLACAYVEAYQITGEALLADTARDVLGYVQRDLSGPEGQFLSAEDADSAVPGQRGEKAEGAYYTWSLGEVSAALGAADGAAFGAALGLGRADNVVDGKHVPVLSQAEARAVLARCRGRLLAARQQRPRPHCDDKAVTAWNGLTLSAFARAYQVLGEPSYRETATRAAAFIRRRLFNPSTGRLYRRFRDGESAVEGYAEDYAFLIQGLLDLYEATFDPADLEWALALQEKQNALFWDQEGGGFFSSAADAPDLPVRMKESHDGAEPSANSVAALNLLRLGAITGSDVCRAMADKIFAAAGAGMREQPESLPQLLSSFAFACGAPRQVVIAGEPDAPDTRALLQAAQHPFQPDKVVLLADGGAGQALLSHYQASIRGMSKQAGRAAAYVCQGFACQEPVTDAQALALLLHGRGTVGR